MPEQLIESQQVVVTVPEEHIGELLKILGMLAMPLKLMVSVKGTSVPDATVGVTQDSQQNPRQGQADFTDKIFPLEEAVCPHCGPACLGGAAHFARAEDSVLYIPSPAQPHHKEREEDGE